MKWRPKCAGTNQAMMPSIHRFLSCCLVLNISEEVIDGRYVHVIGPAKSPAIGVLAPGPSES
jgi:hypothetical protein